MDIEIFFDYREIVSLFITGVYIDLLLIWNKKKVDCENENMMYSFFKQIITRFSIYLIIMIYTYCNIFVIYSLQSLCYKNIVKFEIIFQLNQMLLILNDMKIHSLFKSLFNKLKQSN